MFLVPTYLERSDIHGVGVFTPRPIKAGTLLWEFREDTDWKIPPEAMQQFPEPFRSRMKAYCFVNEAGIYVFCGDNAKYMNHADTPNCDDRGELYTKAARDIAAGEELTCDYRAFDYESKQIEGALYETSSNGLGR